MIKDAINQVADVRIATVNALDDAIYRLENQSSNWQAVLQDTMSKLTSDIQTTVRNELANVASRSVAQAGVEFRCNADFIGKRVRDELIRIKAEYLQQPVPQVEPALCQVVPPAIDRESVPGHVKQLEFYGYNFNDASNLQVFLEHLGGRRSDVTGSLDRPTHYVMTIKFGASGVQLDSTSERFVLVWGGREISTIGVIQPPTPVCEEKIISIQPGSITYMPPHVFGDKDFDGNGPRVIADVRLSVGPRDIVARIYMDAKETKSDWTEARGTTVNTIYTADPDWRIDQVLGPLVSHHEYIDNDDHVSDSFDLGGGGLVRRFVYVGDTGDDEAGTRTKVDVTFNQIRIRVVKATHCVPAGTVRQLHKEGLIDDSTYNRLKPAVER